MGDMADWITDQFMGDLDEYSEQHEDDEGIRCRYCGRAGFTWVETDNGWRLMTPTGKIHLCKAYRGKEEVEDE